MLPRFALFMMAFCGYLVPLMLPVLAPQIASDLHTTVSAVGMVSGAQFLLAGGSSFLMGGLAYSISKRSLSLGFLAVAAAMLIAAGAATSFGGFTFFSLVSAVAYGSLLFFALATVSERFPPEQRADLSGMITSALFMASLIGVPLGLGVGSVSGLGWRAALFCVAALFGLTFALVLAFLPGRQASQAAPKKGDFKSYAELGRSPQARAFFGLTFLTRFGSGLYMTYIPAFLMSERAFPASGFLLTFSLSGGLAFFTSRIAGKVLAAADPTKVLRWAIAAIVSMVLLITYFPLVPVTVVPIILAICLGYTAGESFRMTGLNYIAITRGSPALRTNLLGAFSLLLSLGYAFGAIAGGLIMLAYGGDVAQGFSAILWVAVLVWIFSLLLVGIVSRPWETVASPIIKERRA